MKNELKIRSKLIMDNQFVDFLFYLDCISPDKYKTLETLTTRKRWHILE
ncbi:hypothetical protein J1TS3_16620 [Siminovitchia fordii]|uniref:Uncharacterized protein n=1 Tax=Siminovitchia fordii TaxID=254759 RepID=A0ABQ4K466_9BACI|nr:hypothetical protein J1TS3_16620 [Siminovitchia fordii]